MIRLHEPVARARELLLKHNIRTLPVLDEEGRLAGTLGLRELTLRDDLTIAQVMSKAHTVGQDERVLTLVAPLTDGRTHAVVVTSEDRRVLGIITQTDLLAVLMRLVQAKSLEPSASQAS